MLGGLRAPVFGNRSLSLRCRRRVYVALVLSTLLYGAETSMTKAPDLRRLNAFHHQCVRAIVGISRHQQWDDRVPPSTLEKTLGIDLDIGNIIRERRQRWLGHTGRMDDDRLPKCTLFGELSATRPQHGPRKRWRDVVVDDFNRIHPPVPEKEWLGTAQNCSEWREVIHRRPQPRDVSAEPGYRCACGKTCRRPDDLKHQEPFCRLPPN